jgi:hypothetical protein
MTLRQIADAWNKFWFTPASPVPIALFRIFLGIILLQDVILMRLPDWRIYYVEHSIIPVGDMMSIWWKHDPHIDLMLLLPPGDYWQLAFLCVYTLFVVFITIGLFTRFSCLVAWLMNESMFTHLIMNLCGADVFCELGLIFLACSRCGDALSVDNLIRAFRADWRKEGFRPPLAPQWALRIVQVQLSIAYFICGLAKVTGSQWIDGTALYWVSRYEDLLRFPVPWLYENFLVTKLLTWFTLVFETCFWWMVWIKELRYPILVIGVFFHIGIDYSVNIPLFEWLFMFSYVVFIDAKDLTRIWDTVKALAAKIDGPAFKLFYRQESLATIYMVGVIHRIDVFGRFFPEPGVLALLNEGLYPRVTVQVGERELSGFEAFRFMTLRLPLLWGIVPLVYLPGLAFLSRLMFYWLSAHLNPFVPGTVLISGKLLKAGVS